jgi:hypothetical protein
MKTESAQKTGHAKYLIPVIAALVFSSGICFAAVLIGQISLTVTVGEPLTITSGSSCNLGTIAPSQNGNCVITISNSGNVANTAQVTFAQTSNPNGVLYDLTYDTNPLAVAGSSSGSITATVHIHSDSPTGTLVGEFNVNRV